MALAAVLTEVAGAASLPIRLYTTADGLPHNWITSIRRDKTGYLWFGTREGLARFDGYSFTTYGRAEGLGSSDVTDLLVTRNGDIWVGTAGGLFRFEPKGPRRFIPWPLSKEANAERIGSLAEDRAGMIWIGALSGLYRIDPRVSALRAAERIESSAVHALVVDRADNLWIGGVGALRVRSPDGRIATAAVDGWSGGLLAASDGSVWVGGKDSLVRLVSGKPERRLGPAEGLRKRASRLFETSDGRIWIDSAAGMSQLEPGGSVIQPFGRTGKTVVEDVQTFGEDRDGNLWIGSTVGAMKVVRRALTSYDQGDGLNDLRIASIFENHDGDVHVITSGATFNGGKPFLHLWDGERFHSSPIEAQGGFTTGWNQISFFDRARAWWFGTVRGGFCRAQGPCYGSGAVGRLFEDSHGDVWASSETGETGLIRLNRSTGELKSFTVADGVPRLVPETGFRSATAFREDGSGALWIGGTGWIARYRGGRFDVYDDRERFRNLYVVDFHLDRRGRMWIAGNLSGLLRVDDPRAERPEFRSYGSRDGLSGDRVLCVTEDDFGRIYVCTGRGVDRLDPDAAGDGAVRVRHYTAADGLPPGTVQEAFRDRRGRLWFGTINGLSSLQPEPDPERAPPPIFISSLKVQGVRQPLSELGEVEVVGPTLPSDRNQIEIGFVGLGFTAGELLRYRFHLGGGAASEWGEPSGQRVVDFASLAPGQYRFEVQAIDSAGRSSDPPARVRFTVLAPIWQRWWFLSGAGLALVLAIHGAAQYRLRQALAVERVRIRLATDLHDDVGASLSQIAILSEVVRHRIPEEGEAMERIAQIAREVTDSMSDIVWAISPRHDRLVDLTRRMREFAEEMLVSRDLVLDFQTAVLPGLRVGAQVRREVYLIFKECIHNAVRHSGCSRVTVRAGVEQDGALAISVADDGRGFQVTGSGGEGQGNGMRNMAERAKSLGGECEVESRPGEGTCIRVRIPARALR